MEYNNRWQNEMYNPDIDTRAINDANRMWYADKERGKQQYNKATQHYNKGNITQYELAFKMQWECLTFNESLHWE